MLFFSEQVINNDLIEKLEKYEQKIEDLNNEKEATNNVLKE